ncbi:hypothetical protein CEXT_342201, partial [Caerostris extrusa]
LAYCQRPSYNWRLRCHVKTSQFLVRSAESRVVGDLIMIRLASARWRCHRGACGVLHCYCLLSKVVV